MCAGNLAPEHGGSANILARDKMSRASENDSFARFLTVA